MRPNTCIIENPLEQEQLEKYYEGINMNIGWFGLGKLGMICAEMIVEKGHNVTGYDIKEVDSDKVDVVTNPRLAVENKDFVFVAVQTLMILCMEEKSYYTFTQIKTLVYKCKRLFKEN